MSQWADRHVRLPEEYAHEPGPWDSDRYPYQRAMMDAVNERGVWRIVFMTSSAVGKSSCIDNILGYFVDQDPSPILMVEPTIDDAESYSKERLAPLVEATEVLARRFGDQKTRTSSGTLRFKKFPGGFLVLGGANSAAGLQRRHLRVAIGDEVDSWPRTAGNQGDPVSLMVQRTARFPNRLIILSGTPSVEGVSRLAEVWPQSDQRRYFVPCLSCGAFQYLTWKHVVWENHAPETARLRCESCAALHTDAERLEIVRRGVWRPTAPFRGTAGFHVWEAYAAARLEPLVEEWLEKKKSRESLQTFVNLRLGELWKQDEGEAPAWASIKARAEDPERADRYRIGEIPAGVLFLACGADTHIDRIELVVRGFGRGEESWLIHHVVLWGDPVFDEVWEQFDSIVTAAYRHPYGGEMRIACTMIDSGGWRTGAVYDRVRTRGPHVLAIKGANRENLPILVGAPTPQDVSFNGKLVKNGVMLWHVGSAAAKAEVYARLKVEKPGPRAMHFPAGLPDAFYEQLTSEQVITRFKKGVPHLEWFLPEGKRNEALDCEAYCLAAAMRAGLQRANWDELERAMRTAPAPVREEPRVVRSKWVHG